MIKSWLFHDFLEVWGFLLSPQSYSGNETVIWKSPKQKETIYVNRMQGDKGHKWPSNLPNRAAHLLLT